MLPCDAAPASTAPPPANVRFGQQAIDAWQALWGFSGTSGDDNQVRGALQAQQVVRTREKEGYFPWVLDQARLDVVLANRVSMVPELPAARFRWVPYDEAIIRGDFAMLMATEFLEDLRIEVIDEPYENGVVGKHVVFRLEERASVTIVARAMRTTW